MVECLYREDRVLEIVPFGRSTMWRMIEAGRFPRPAKLGRLNVWVESELQDFVERIKEERKQAA